jgi:hypothetical protein
MLYQVFPSFPLVPNVTPVYFQEARAILSGSGHLSVVATLGHLTDFKASKYRVLLYRKQGLELHEILLFRCLMRWLRACRVRTS